MRTLPAGPRRLRPSAAAARMLLVLLYLCPMAAAQPQFADVPMQHLPANADFTHSITAADVDGDGDADLILGNRGAQNRLYLSEGDSTFSDVTTTRLPADTDLTTAIATGDVDGDGDLDVVVGNAAANRLYLNDGTGVFTDASAARLPADNDETLAVAFVDVDGDGDLDLVLGTSRGQDRLYINDGDGTFVDETAARLPTDTSSTFALGAADIDGDGDADLIVGKPWGVQDLLYENDGQGVFTDRTAGQLPPQNRGTTGIALGDIDADGDLDVVIGCNG
ncbi:MAG: VCBS repeat-containing protein, partial [Planctomycetota bacterium]